MVNICSSGQIMHCTVDLFPLNCLLLRLLTDEFFGSLDLTAYIYIYAWYSHSPVRLPQHPEGCLVHSPDYREVRSKRSREYKLVRYAGRWLHRITGSSDQTVSTRCWWWDRSLHRYLISKRQLESWRPKSQSISLISFKNERWIICLIVQSYGKLQVIEPPACCIVVLRHTLAVAPWAGWSRWQAYTANRKQTFRQTRRKHSL